jgi:hypothetical protein
MHTVFWGGLQPTILQAAREIHLLADVFSKAMISLYAPNSTP